MKVKLDFVTNSSSTSFILFLENDKLCNDDFLTACGANKDSPLNLLIDELYKLLTENMKPIEVFLRENNMKLSNLPTPLHEKIKSHLEKGKKVYGGSLSGVSPQAPRFRLKTQSSKGVRRRFSVRPHRRFGSLKP